jgi:hypothetical protein
VAKDNKPHSLEVLFQPVAVVKGMWTCCVPPVTCSGGAQVFRGADLPQLLALLQRSIFHSTFHINRQSERLKAQTEEIRQLRQLNDEFLQIRKAHR